MSRPADSDGLEYPTYDRRAADHPLGRRESVALTVRRLFVRSLKASEVLSFLGAVLLGAGGAIGAVGWRTSSPGARIDSLSSRIEAVAKRIDTVRGRVDTLADNERFTKYMLCVLVRHSDPDAAPLDCPISRQDFPR